jgi:hypothetical protein
MSGYPWASAGTDAFRKSAGKRAEDPAGTWCAQDDKYLQKPWRPTMREHDLLSPLQHAQKPRLSHNALTPKSPLRPDWIDSEAAHGEFRTAEMSLKQHLDNACARFWPPDQV